MAEYDAADCLQRFKDCVGIGANSADTTDAQFYALLTNGMRRVQLLLASHVPTSQARTREQLSTSDNKTYTATAHALGHLELRDGKRGPVILPGSDWDESADVYVQGTSAAGLTTVRWPNDRTRTFSNGLWATYVPRHGTVDASTNPTLLPLEARQAAIYDAAVEWALQGGYVDPTPFKDMLRRELWGDADHPGNLGVLGSLKLQFYGQGALAAAPGQAYWWRSGDLT